MCSDRCNVISDLWKLAGETSVEHSAMSTSSGLQCERLPEFSPTHCSVKKKLDKMDFVELNNHGNSLGGGSDTTGVGNL